MSLLNFIAAYGLLIVNCYFKKEDQLVTFKTGNINTKIDYFLMSVNNKMLCKDYEVIPSEFFIT